MSYSELQVTFFREKNLLLSRFSGNRTVGFFRAKKESCSTRSGQCVDSGFMEFRQTPRGRGFILLGFYTLFKCFVMFRLVRGLERPFDRFQNLESK